ncbi:MAG: tetratricopeptide repeat protein [Bacteroidetes bacterium]|nr:tetratricopeptide repeat protein [Bacteroidota bacterium]
MILTILNLVFAVILGGNPIKEASSKESKTEEAKLFKTAMKQFDMGKSLESRQILESLVKRSPENAIYNYELGRNIYYTQAKKEIAITYFETAIQYCGNDTMADVYYMLGELYQKQKNYDKAIEAYTNMKRFTKSNASGKKLQAELDTKIVRCKKLNSIAISKARIVAEK